MSLKNTPTKYGIKALDNLPAKHKAKIKEVSFFDHSPPGNLKYVAVQLNKFYQYKEFGVGFSVIKEDTISETVNRIKSAELIFSADSLKKYIKSRSALNTAELARSSGVSRSSFNQWLTGARDLPEPALIELFKEIRLYGFNPKFWT